MQYREVYCSELKRSAVQCTKVKFRSVRFSSVQFSSVQCHHGYHTSGQPLLLLLHLPYFCSYCYQAHLQDLCCCTPSTTEKTCRPDQCLHLAKTAETQKGEEDRRLVDSNWWGPVDPIVFLMILTQCLMSLWGGKPSHYMKLLQIQKL